MFCALCPVLAYQWRPLPHASRGGGKAKVVRKRVKTESFSTHFDLDRPVAPCHCAQTKKAAPKGGPGRSDIKPRLAGQAPEVRCHALPAIEAETQVFMYEYLFPAFWTDHHILTPFPEAACLGGIKASQPGIGQVLT